MDLNKPVIVSALFDIDRPNWSNFKMSYDTYTHWSESLLSIDCPLVIFTEEKFFKTLYDKRRQYDTKMVQTKIIVRDKTELPLYKTLYEPVKQLMESEEFAKIVQFHDVPEMCQPWYNIIMYSKLQLMLETYVHQYLKNDIVIWKDIAVYREDISMYKNVKWPDLSKIDQKRPTFFTHHEQVRIANNKSHLLSQMRFLQGGCFIIPGYLLHPLNKKYLTLVDQYLKEGYIGSDEKYLDLLVKDNPEDYVLIKSNWRKYFEKVAF